MGDARAIDRFATRQHGVFNTAQARAAGFDRHAVARRLLSGEWRQLDYRVFALPSAAPTWERQVWVGLLSRPRAVVGGTTAANLHGFRGFTRTKPVILVPGSSNARSSVARVVRAAHFDELETTRVRGFPVTTVGETVLTLAASADPRRLEMALDDLLLSNKLVVEDLDAILKREDGRRRRGITLLKELLDDRRSSAPSHESSYLEKRLEGLLVQMDMPLWLREHPFTLRDRPCRVDVYVPSWGLVIEADGRNWHARVADFEADRRRDNELATQGMQVVRLTYRILESDPNECMTTILSVGRVRSA